MGSRRKRQKLSEDGADAVVADDNEQTLDHSKSTSSVGAEDPAKHSQSTLFIRSIPVDTTNEALADHFSQSFPIKHAVVVTNKETGKCKGYGFITFADHEDACRALEEFNGSEFRGSKLKVDFAERRHREEGVIHGARPTLEEETTPRLSSRLIVRNLPWSIDTPEKLTRLFLSFGKVNQAIVPKNPQGRMKGFGIVLLRGRKNAEHALEQLNGKEVDGRILAIDWAVDRETWEKAQADARASAVETAADGTEPEKTSVDSQSSKNENHAGSSQSDEEESEAGDQDDETDEDDEDDEDMDKEEHVKKTLMTSNEATLFIRNLPFTTTDEDLYEHFEDFGPVRYARIVIDHATERPRGTGFVCFRTKDDADVCLREAPRATKAKDSKGKKDSSASNGPSILENELADYSGRYTLDGRVLHITRAVDKSEADRLTAEGTASRNKRDRDKRRLYLLGEGTIPSNSPLYQKLSASEIAMRDASAKQRRKLIDTNPSLHLSLTRLSVRNIPRSVSSKDLKTLAREAVVGFAKDVKESKRQALSKEERARGGEEMARAEKERKRKGKGVVKQAKIIFEGSEGGKVEEASGRSRGYGFIEYYTHRSALMGLRWLNGHSIEYQAKEKKVKATKDDIQDRKKRLIVEFAIENAQVVKRRKEKEDKAREKPKNTEEPHQAKGVAAQEQGKPSRTPNKKRKHDSSAQGGDSGKDEASKSKQRKIIAKKRQARKIQRRQVKAKA